MWVAVGAITLWAVGDSWASVETDKLRSQVTRDVPGFSVSAFKERRGSLGPRSPVLPRRRQLQTDWLYSWTRWGAAWPPSRDTLTRWLGGGALHATITTNDARARTERAEGGDMARPGSWFGLKKIFFRGRSGAARGPLGEPLLGWGRSHSFPILV